MTMGVIIPIVSIMVVRESTNARNIQKVIDMAISRSLAGIPPNEMANQALPIIMTGAIRPVIRAVVSPVNDWRPCIVNMVKMTVIQRIFLCLRMFSFTNVISSFFRFVLKNG